jgi:hypothetical protein
LNLNQVLLIVQIGLIPSIISLTKYYFGEKSYKLLYIYIITSYLTEVITNRLIYSNYTQSSIILAKTYMLFEFIILIELMKKMSKSSNYIKTILIFGVVIWFIENIFLIKLYESEKYFNVIASIILFVIFIYSLTVNLNKNYKSFFKEADIVIIITILFNISFRIVFEFLYYNYEDNIPIIQSISRIYILVNFTTNILFIYCLTCIKNTKKLISSF